jgi:hypothetical protein
MRHLFQICYEAPDAATGGTGDAPAVDPAVAAAADPPAVENEPAPEPEPAKPAEPAKKPWFLERISQESARALEAQTRADAAERRAREAEALAERLRAGQNTDGHREPEPRHAPPQDHQATIRAEAQKLRLYEDSAEVKRQGLAKYGSGFNDTLAILNAAGAVSDDFVSDVLAIDRSNAHDLFHKIASDPETAASLAQMDPRRRIAELTKMSLAPAKAVETAPSAQKSVSKAPPPPPKIDAGTSQAKAPYSDDMTDEEFTATWKERMAKRQGGRR